MVRTAPRLPACCEPYSRGASVPGRLATTSASHRIRNGAPKLRIRPSNALPLRLRSGEQGRALSSGAVGPSITSRLSSRLSSRTRDLHASASMMGPQGPLPVDANLAPAAGMLGVVVALAAYGVASAVREGLDQREEAALREKAKRRHQKFLTESGSEDEMDDPVALDDDEEDGTAANAPAAGPERAGAPTRTVGSALAEEKAIVREQAAHKMNFKPQASPQQTPVAEAAAAPGVSADSALAEEVEQSVSSAAGTEISDVEDTTAVETAQAAVGAADTEASDVEDFANVEISQAAAGAADTAAADAEDTTPAETAQVAVGAADTEASDVEDTSPVETAQAAFGAADTEASDVEDTTPVKTAQVAVGAADTEASDVEDTTPVKTAQVAVGAAETEASYVKDSANVETAQAAVGAAEMEALDVEDATPVETAQAAVGAAETEASDVEDSANVETAQVAIGAAAASMLPVDKVASGSPTVEDTDTECGFVSITSSSSTASTEDAAEGMIITVEDAIAKEPETAELSAGGTTAEVQFMEKLDSMIQEAEAQGKKEAEQAIAEKETVSAEDGASVPSATLAVELVSDAVPEAESSSEQLTAAQVKVSIEVAKEEAEVEAGEPPALQNNASQTAEVASRTEEAAALAEPPSPEENKAVGPQDIAANGSEDAKADGSDDIAADGSEDTIAVRFDDPAVDRLEDATTDSPEVVDELESESLEALAKENSEVWISQEPGAEVIMSAGTIELTDEAEAELEAAILAFSSDIREAREAREAEEEAVPQAEATGPEPEEVAQSTKEDSSIATAAGADTTSEESPAPTVAQLAAQGSESTTNEELQPADGAPAEEGEESIASSAKGPDPMDSQVKLLYRTDWEVAVVHGSVNGEEWAGHNMDKALHPGWHVANFTVADGAQAPPLEFVVTNKEYKHWDKPMDGSNYLISEAGIYTLRDGILKKLSSGAPFMVVSDLDGTMVGDDGRTARFKAFWESGPMLQGSKLVYSTGRSLGKFQELQEEKAGALAVPDVLILGVGTEIYNLSPSGGWEKDGGWEKELNRGWKLPVILEAAYAALAAVGKEEMHFRPPEEQNDHKVTCGVHTSKLDQAVGIIQSMLDEKKVEANIISSGEGDWRYLDLVSKQAGKLESLEYVAASEGFGLDRTVACGDSGNDILMLAGRSRAIIVGNAQADLRNWVDANPSATEVDKASGLSRLRVTEAPEADGILEGLEYFGFH